MSTLQWNVFFGVNEASADRSHVSVNRFNDPTFPDRHSRESPNEITDRSNVRGCEEEEEGVRVFESFVENLIRYIEGGIFYKQKFFLGFDTMIDLLLVPRIVKDQ